MNAEDTRNDNSVWERGVSDEFHATMNQIRTDAAPVESVERFMNTAARIDDIASCHQSHGSSSPRRPVLAAWIRQSRRRLRWLAAVSAALLIAVSVSFLVLPQRSAWAQVVEAVAEQPWMRLTLEPPTVALPPSESLEDATLWFSRNEQVAAAHTNKFVVWMNLANSDEYRYDKRSGRLTLKRLTNGDSRVIGLWMRVLSPFEPEAKSLSDAAGPSVTETTIDGTVYQEFQFRIQESGEGDAIDSMTVRVNKASKRPVQLKVREALFAVDYPDMGPADIYALGVPREASAEDPQELEKYFRPRPALVYDDYEATEVRFGKKQYRKAIKGAVRYRSVAGKPSAEYADQEQLRVLSDKVLFFDDDSGPGPAPEVQWWMAEVDKLDFSPGQLSGFNYPHNHCYVPWGSMGSYRSVHPSDIAGLESAVEIRGPQRSVWLDPERDHIVRRYEQADAQGGVIAMQHDEVVQDSQGTWFATRSRSGRIAQRADELSGDDVNIRIVNVEFLEREPK